MSELPELPRSEAPPPAARPRPVTVRLPQRQPTVTYTILALTTLVYLLQMGTQFFLGYDLPAALGVKSNSHIVAGELWRLLTPMLLHGSLLHIGFNMYALYILGPELERHYGHWKFLALYVASGFAGIVVSFLLTSASSLGASTSIFGLLAAHGVFAYQNQEVFGRRARMALRNIVFIALINFFIGLTPGIDNWGHFGGLLGGGLVAWFGGPLYRLEAAEDPLLDELRLVDRRDGGAVWLAAVGVGLLFGSLAAWKISFLVP